MTEERLREIDQHIADGGGDCNGTTERALEDLVAEVRRLRALVEAAYREGFWDGEDAAPIGELPAGYGDTAWWMSDARKATKEEA